MAYVIIQLKNFKINPIFSDKSYFNIIKLIKIMCKSSIYSMKNEEKVSSYKVTRRG